MAPYNQVPELDDRVACVIVEPVAANMGLVAPVPGVPRGPAGRLRRGRGRCSIFDEVITGFRLGEGGASGWSGVRPDLWCFGKVIGGGLPVGAFGGRADVLASLAPDGPVYQAGTLSGNPAGHGGRDWPCSTALDAASYAALSARVARFGAALRRRAVDRPGQGGHGRWRRATSSRRRYRWSALCSASSSCRPARDRSVDYDGAAASAATGLYPRLFRSMLDRGVALAPGPYEVAFPSMAHGEAELDRTLDVASEAIMDVVAG